MGAIKLAACLLIVANSATQCPGPNSEGVRLCRETGGAPVVDSRGDFVTCNK